MTQFNLYSDYYNLLYKDKNYAGETAYVSGKIKKFTPGATAILDLGCGTGRHDLLLSKEGYRMTGVDLSDQMLEIAESEKRASGVESFQLHKSDIRTFDCGQKFDAVVSLFHVMSYQNSNSDVADVLNTAARHLQPGGVFIFDFWYGPAVLSEKPSIRVKRVENESIAITRIAEPEVDCSRNIVTVNYDVFIADKASKMISEIRETHRMRYFFEPEFALFFKENGFTLLEAEEWMTGSRLSESTWGALYVCQSTGMRGTKR